MFCSECGTKNEEGTRFCEECGAKLEGGRNSISISESNKILSLRHPKESMYFAIGAIIGGIAWFVLIWFIILFAWIAIPIAIVLWMMEQWCKVELLGNSVKVTQYQYPEIFDIVKNHTQRLNIKKLPQVFIVTSHGIINAIALKFLKDKYIILLSELVDTMLAHSSIKELSSIIGHEVGHHAAGHTAWWRTLLLKPATVVPFLGLAYSRACELTADRIGMYLCGDRESACRGLVTLACGSEILSPKTNIEAFKEQEALLPPIFTFFHNLYSTHPRITKRIIELEKASYLI